MKKIICLLILILFSSCNIRAYEARLERKGKIKCGWYGKMTTEQRRKTFPFSEAHKIVLVSYHNYAVDEDLRNSTTVTPWGDTITFGNHTNKYYSLITRSIIDTVKVFNRVYSVHEKVELNQNQIDSLSHLLFNYKLNYTIKYSQQYESCCYKPRNSIIFYDKQGRPIFNYEMCFECFRRKYFTAKNDFKDLIGCMNNELYKDFFKQCQIHYGIDTP